jgi:hypothetical protein
MNWTEEDIDQLFRDSANQLNVPFQESYWTEMEALLPQTKKKKGLGWIFGGTIVCLALISTFFFPEAPAKAGNASNETVNNQTKSLTQTNSVSAIEKLQEKAVDALLITEKTAKNISRFKQTTKKLLVNTETSFTSIEDVNAGGEAVQTIQNQFESPSQREEQPSFSIDKLQMLALPKQSISLATSNFKNLNLKRKSNVLYVQLGAGLAESFMQTKEDNWMPTINIGAGYQYSPEGFGFTAGLNLNTTLSNNLEINRKSKVYNFGSTNYEQNFKYKQIYTLELPVSIDFRKNKQTFSVGFAPTFIASSLMRFSQLEDGNVSHDEYYIGQKVGLNQFGFKPSVGYQLELAKGWNVGMQLSTQLIQQVDDSQFIGIVRNNPLSGQITIRKSITKF